MGARDVNSELRDGDGLLDEEGIGRPGPEMMANDSWGGVPDDDNDRYQGRRRAPMTRRRWIVVAFALVGVVGLVGVGLLGAALLSDGDGLPPTSLPAAENTDVSTDGSPGSPSAAALTPSATGTTPATPTTGPAPGPPPFTTVTVEAEAGSVTLIGSAQVQTEPGASGGRIVGKLGNWGQGQPGALRINNLAIPASGDYVIEIYYTNQDKPGAHTAMISVSGAKAVSVTFGGGHTCCGVRQVTVTLAAGVHTITISNPTDIAPAIDRIVVSRPS